MEELYSTEHLFMENSGSDVSLNERWSEKYKDVMRLMTEKSVPDVSFNDGWWSSNVTLNEPCRKKYKGVIRLDYRKRMVGITKKLREKGWEKRWKEQKITTLLRQVESLFTKRYAEHGIKYSSGYLVGLANRSSPRTLPPHQKKISSKVRDRLSELGIYDNDFPGTAGLSKCYNY
jgi:hypothetical protein